MLKFLIFLLFFVFNSNHIYATDIDKDKVINFLKEKDPVVFKDLKIKDTSIKSIYKLELDNGNFIYYNLENDFFIKGELLSYEKEFINLTKKEQNDFNKENIKEFKDKFKDSFIHFKSNKVPSIMSIYVFTDYTCPFCKKLHQNIKLFQDSGIDVYYIPFPRKSINDYETVRGLQKIMCSKDKSEEFSISFEDPKSYSRNVKTSDIDCPEAFDILQFNKYADIFNVRGTPTTITENGSVIHGFNSPEEFAYQLRKIMESN